MFVRFCTYLFTYAIFHALVCTDTSLFWLIVVLRQVSITFIFIILLTRPSLHIITSVGKMMPRRFACGWKSRLPHKEHNMCRFELHLRSCSYRNPEKTTDLPPQVTDKLHHKHLCCIRIRLATRNGINYLSPLNVYCISLTGYHILAHRVKD